MNIEFLLKSIKSNGEKVAIIDGDQPFSFQDIFAQYEDCKNEIKKQIPQCSVVAVLADFAPVSIAMVLGLIEHDCILVPISNTIKSIDSYLEISQTEYFIDLSQHNISISNLNKKVTHKMLLELKKRGTPGLILFSSGTTGEPKAALHDLVFLLNNYKVTRKTLRTITFLLFDHIGGFNTLMNTLANGGSIVAIPSRNIDVVCTAIEKYKVELLPTSPTFLNMFLINRMHEQYDLSSLKMISYGTEPMADSTLKMLHEVLPNVTLKQTYGLSEVGILPTKSESSDSLWLKLGGAGFETKVVDDILYIKAKSAMMGYLNAPNPFDEEGWFNTKDKVEIKGDYIKILGRTTDIINVGGEKVYPIEVESTFLKCPGVIDVRIYSEKNAITGSSIVAEILVHKENNNRQFTKTLRNYCVEQLERFKIPSKFILTENALYTDRLKKQR